MTCFELANMGGEGVAEIGLALKVEWGPVFAGESREKAYQRSAVCHKAGSIPSPITDARPLAIVSRRRPARDRKYFFKSKIISE